VEDNEELRTFIGQILGSTYHIAEAGNGSEAIDKARALVPDIVIADVMMPGVDGFSFCKMLKADPLTSHIPVLMLTARIQPEHRLQGYQAGADAYLTKPFRAEELKAILFNQLQHRKQLHLYYRQHPHLWGDAQNLTSAADEFLKKLKDIVEQNMDKAGFGADMLAHEAGFSRSQLHRKLQSMVGCPTSEFIREVRLRRAAFLLSQRQGNISEVAYQVGFENMSYFSKCFKEYFGCTPSEYSEN
jgi:YesN/AraC family two-component response regulator